MRSRWVARKGRRMRLVRAMSKMNILYTSSSIVQVAHVKPVQFPKRGEPGLRSRRAVEMATSHRHHTATKIKQVFSYWSDPTTTHSLSLHRLELTVSRRLIGPKWARSQVPANQRPGHSGARFYQFALLRSMSGTVITGLQDQHCSNPIPITSTGYRMEIANI